MTSLRVQSLFAGVIDGIYVEGHISNETNLRTIGFRVSILRSESSQSLMVADSSFLSLLRTLAEATASLNFNLYNRLVQELVVNSGVLIVISIVDYLANDFRENDGVKTDASQQRVIYSYRVC